MSRKTLLLNLALLALAGVLVWQIRVRWLEAKAHEREVLSKAPRPPVALPPPPAPPIKPAQPADYIDVAQKTLFARDRNPSPIVDPPPPPPPAPPEKPMPALPYYYGQMAIGAPVVVLSVGSEAQKGYHPGDEVGPFKVIAFDHEMITFEWESKIVERKLVELRPKEQVLAQQQAAASAAASSAPAPPPPSTQIRSLTSSAPAASNGAPTDPQLGVEVGGGSRGCAAGDNSPAGTVLDGYRKVITRGLMGTSCHWEQVTK